MVDKHKGLDRDELSIEISGAVDNAHITDTFNIKGRLMRVVDTQPYPKGEHPLEMMSKPTAPYPVKLHGLLMELCEGDSIVECGVPSEEMEEDFGTGVPKKMDKKEVTQSLTYKIATEVIYGAKMSIHDMETEKIEVDQISVEAEISRYFDERIHEALLSARLDERLRTFFTLQSLKNEICSQLIKIAPENQARYVTSLKNAISYIIDSVISRGINRSITLEIPNV